jgi:YD repeat-containing protein
MLKRALACLAAIGALSIVTRAQSPVRYVYDDLGRLVGVIDQNGNAATYAYDAVGNLLSITRTDSSTVSIISVSPATGAASGTTVTINGTGFSATASQDTVTFNGTAATVTSATGNVLVVVVPNGATTGAISITTPSGTTTSASAFVITTINLAPTITSFTPIVGTAGTGVTVTGTNFDTLPPNDRLTLNVTSSAVPPSSATPTQLAVSVPDTATSGRITVRTPLGTAVSTGDFFVPPSPHTAADVLVTGRLTLGTGTTVTMGTAGKIALELFDLPVGHRGSVTLTSDTIASANATVFDPNGVSLGTVLFGSTGGFIDVFTGQITGSSTVEIAPVGSSTGHTTLTVYDVPADLSGSLTPTSTGSAATLTFSTPGQNARYTFSGSAGDRVSLKLSTGPISAVSMLNPDGSVLATGTVGVVTSFIDTQVLPTTGTYAIVVDPTGAGTGSVTLTLYAVPADLTGSMTFGNAANLTISTPGQNATYTFAGTSGHRVSLAINGSAVSGTVSIRNSSGTVLGSATSGIIAAFIEPVTLATTDTYSVVVDPSSYNTGSLTMTLYDVAADGTGTITTDGTATNVTISANNPGQNWTLTFSGMAGHRVSLSTSTFAPSGTVQVLTSTGTVLGSVFSGISAGFMEPVTLPTTDTYKLFVNPSGNATGTVTLRLYDVPADFTGSATINGSGVTVPLSTPGQNGTVTFSGTAGQQVNVHLTSNSIPGVTVKLLKPDGTQLTSTISGSSSFNLWSSPQTLPTTGTYTIVIDPSGANTGSITVTVSNP